MPVRLGASSAALHCLWVGRSLPAQEWGIELPGGRTRGAWSGACQAEQVSGHAGGLRSSDTVRMRPKSCVPSVMRQRLAVVA